jgi:hypothetical protein
MKDSTEAIQKATDKGFNRAIEKIISPPFVRAFTALLPYIGGAITELLDNKLNSIRSYNRKLCFGH